MFYMLTALTSYPLYISPDYKITPGEPIYIPTSDINDEMLSAYRKGFIRITDVKLNEIVIDATPSTPKTPPTPIVTPPSLIPSEPETPVINQDPYIFSTVPVFSFIPVQTPPPPQLTLVMRPIYNCEPTEPKVSKI